MRVYLMDSQFQNPPYIFSGIPVRRLTRPCPTFLSCCGCTFETPMFSSESVSWSMRLNSALIHPVYLSMFCSRAWMSRYRFKRWCSHHRASQCPLDRTHDRSFWIIAKECYFSFVWPEYIVPKVFGWCFFNLVFQIGCWWGVCIL